MSKNRRLTVMERNGVAKVFDGKAKRMPVSLSETLSDAEVLETFVGVGLTVVTLDVGKTAEEMKEEKRKADNALLCGRLTEIGKTIAEEKPKRVMSDSELMEIIEDAILQKGRIFKTEETE